MAGTRGPQAPFAVVLSAVARVHPTMVVCHPLGCCPGPVVGGFALGTQPLCRAEEYLGCGVVWCAGRAIRRRQRPGCRAYGHSKTGKGVCVCASTLLRTYAPPGAPLRLVRVVQGCLGNLLMPRLLGQLPLP